VGIHASGILIPLRDQTISNRWREEHLPSVLVSMGVSPLKKRRSKMQEQPQEESTWRYLNPSQFYLMTKEYQSLSTAV